MNSKKARISLREKTATKSQRARASGAFRGFLETWNSCHFERACSKSSSRGSGENVPPPSWTLPRTLASLKNIKCLENQWKLIFGSLCNSHAVQESTLGKLLFAGTPQIRQLLNRAFGPSQNVFHHSLGICHTEVAKQRHVPSGFVKTSTTAVIFDSVIRTDLV